MYVLYPDETGGNWRIQAVPVSPDSFDSRKALPEQWRGLRDEKLSEVAEIDGGIFVHASGFIGGKACTINATPLALTNFNFSGNKTKQGALLMAKKALTM